MGTFALISQVTDKPEQTQPALIFFPGFHQRRRAGANAKCRSAARPSAGCCVQVNYFGEG
jgi:hypothetical protein